MPEMPGRPSSRLEPSPAWTVLTDSPLKGLALAREAGTILAWDEGDQLYLLDTGGRHRSVSRCPGKLLDAAISDDGRLVALLLEGSRLLCLSGDLEPVADRAAPPDAQVAGRRSPRALRRGRHADEHESLLYAVWAARGKFETKQALAHLTFVPDRPFLLGGGPVRVADRRGAPLRVLGKLAADIAWEEGGLSNVGRLTSSGDGGVILASCYTHGVQALRPSGPQRGGLSSRRNRRPCRSGLRRPGHRGGDSGRRARDSEPGRPGPLADRPGTSGHRSGDRSPGAVRDLRAVHRRGCPPRPRTVQPPGRRRRTEPGKGRRAGCCVSRSRTPEAPPVRSGGPTGRFRWSAPTIRPRPPSWPSWTTRRGSVLISRTNRLRSHVGWAEPGGRPRDPGDRPDLAYHSGMDCRGDRSSDRSLRRPAQRGQPARRQPRRGDASGDPHRHVWPRHRPGARPGGAPHSLRTLDLEEGIEFAGRGPG